MNLRLLGMLPVCAHSLWHRPNVALSKQLFRDTVAGRRDQRQNLRLTPRLSQLPGVALAVRPRMIALVVRVKWAGPTARVVALEPATNRSACP